MDIWDFSSLGTYNTLGSTMGIKTRVGTCTLVMAGSMCSKCSKCSHYLFNNLPNCNGNNRINPLSGRYLIEIDWIDDSE